MFANVSLSARKHKKSGKSGKNYPKKYFDKNRFIYSTPLEPNHYVFRADRHERRNDWSADGEGWSEGQMAKRA